MWGQPSGPTYGPDTEEGASGFDLYPYGEPAYQPIDPNAAQYPAGGAGGGSESHFGGNNFPAQPGADGTTSPPGGVPVHGYMPTDDEDNLRPGESQVRLN